MDLDTAVHALVGLLPVATFLAALVALDSYKLVALRTVLAVVAAGAAVAGVSYVINGLLIGWLDVDVRSYARFAGPLVEEAIKAVVVVALLRLRRIAFLVDAAVLGFAVGAGFSIIENLFYQHVAPDAGLGTWIVRGFGTALMHGGVTAIQAMVAIATLDRRPDRPWLAVAPGFAIATVLHAAYNHMFLSPALSTLAVVVVLPPLLYAVFRRGERAVGQWLGRGFDADAEMLEILTSGALSDSRVGRYLDSLKRRFAGPVVADILCYLRLRTELALRAKGLIMMRESGFDVPVDDATRAKFEELRYLEKSIGATGLLAIQPMLHLTHRDLWQLNLLDS
jgi:RsiW-degrading membrane proteinase PrsW (M82 family)